MNSLPLAAHLAILQQAEYDLNLWQRWWQNGQRSTTTLEGWVSLQPEKWTPKLRLLRLVAGWWGRWWPVERALPWALHVVTPIDRWLRGWQMVRAVARLRYYQARGLVVVAVAGSYGKTTLKHLIWQVASSKFYTLVSPASFNTPLGIASTLQQLTARHKVLVVELGEYYPGDIARLLSWLRPQIGVLGPIGFAHLDRFGSPSALVDTLAEMTTAPAAPHTLIIDDNNRAYIHPTARQTVLWYGQQDNSDMVWNTKKVTLAQISGTVRWAGTTASVAWPLLGVAQATNALAAATVGVALGISVTAAWSSLGWVVPAQRRLVVTNNPNGSVVVDNSYNTNPGSWQMVVELWRQLKLDNLAIITAGFLELDAATARAAHIQMAADIARRARLVGLIRTRDNHDLITTLTTKLAGTTKQLVIGDTWDEVMDKIYPLLPPQVVLWLEGGVRELYQ